MRRTVVVIAAFLSGCAGGRAARGEKLAPGCRAAAAVSPTGVAALDERCPMDIPFTTALLTATPEGALITYSSGDGKEDELRERVRELAERHNERHGTAAADPGTGPGGGGAAEGRRRMPGPPPSRAMVEDVPDGARLLLRASDPADVERLQDVVEREAGYLRRRGCTLAYAE